jgi:hypothetical protein
MIRTLAALAFATVALGACQKDPPPAVEAVPEAAAPAPAEPAPAPFTVGDLAEGDGEVMGCQTMLSRIGASPVHIFYSGAGEAPAQGFIRIDGTLMTVDLATATESETGGVRTFATTDGALSVVQTTTVGEAHPESDSVDLSGTLDVTYNGVSLSIPVEGGTAC